MQHVVLFSQSEELKNQIAPVVNELGLSFRCAGFDSPCFETWLDSEVNLILIHADGRSDASGVCHKIVELAEEKPPLIALADSENETALLECLRAGAEDMIALPLKRYEFVVRVRSLLSLASWRTQAKTTREINTIISKLIIAINHGFSLGDALAPVIEDISTCADAAGAGIFIYEDSKPMVSIFTSENERRPEPSPETLEQLQTRLSPVDDPVSPEGGGRYRLFPLMDRSELSGVFFIRTEPGKPIDDADEAILMYFCNIIAMTISRYRALIAYEDITRGYQKELDNLARIQQMLLPSSMPEIEGYELASFYHPAESAGGDYFDVIPLTERHVAFVVADVSGHGAPAAMNMGIARSILHTIRFSQQTEPAQSVFFVNKLLGRLLSKGTYITMFYAILDLETHELAWCNAGHPPAYLRSSGEVRSLGDPTNGPALGWWSDADFDEGRIVIEAGDLVLFYTDGVNEALNEAGAEYSMERIESVVRQVETPDSQACIDALQADLESHIGEQAVYDDITMLALKRTK